MVDAKEVISDVLEPLRPERLPEVVEGLAQGGPSSAILEIRPEHGQELITAAAEGIPIKVAVLNNSSLGMVRQWQTLFYDKRYSAIDLSGGIPDYVKLAEAMGCVAMRASSPEEVRPVIEKSIAVDDRPVVVEFQVDPEEMVFPMVPAGGSNDDIVLGPEDLK